MTTSPTHTGIEIGFEMRDVEVFNIPDTKTRIATVQNYFFPRLELLLRETMELIAEVYGVDPYEKMTFTYHPSNRKNALINRSFYEVRIGLSGKRVLGRPLQHRRRDGEPYHFHPTYLNYCIDFDGSIRIELLPFRYHVSRAFVGDVCALYEENFSGLSSILGLQQISHSRAAEFVELRDLFRVDEEKAAGSYFYSPTYFFPVSEERGLWNSKISFVALYPLLEAFCDLGVGEMPVLAQRLDAFKEWYLALEWSEEDEADVTEDDLEEPDTDIEIPALDSYRFVRAGSWWSVLARDKWTCCSCGRSTKDEGVILEVDHIVPRSKGGTDDVNNLQTLCKKCNIGKSNRDATDLRRSTF